MGRSATPRTAPSGNPTSSIAARKRGLTLGFFVEVVLEFFRSEYFGNSVANPAAAAGSATATGLGCSGIPDEAGSPDAVLGTATGGRSGVAVDELALGTGATLIAGGGEAIAVGLAGAALAVADACAVETWASCAKAQTGQA